MTPWREPPDRRRVVTNLLCGFLVLATVVIALCATVGWDCAPSLNPAMRYCSPFPDGPYPERVFVRPASPMVGTAVLALLLHVRRRFLALPPS